MKKPTYYTMLPHQVRLDHRLCPLARLLYSEIAALSQQTGYCWANNTFFAQLYQVKPKAVTRWLKELRQNGYIRVDVSQGNQRRIYLTEMPILPTESVVNEPPRTGGTPARSEGVPDNWEGGGPPLGEVKVGSLLTNKNNNKIEQIIKATPFLELGKREEGVFENEALHSPTDDVDSPNPRVAPRPLPPAQKDAPPPFVKPSVKEAEDYMLGQKELCPSVLTARAQALRFVNYYESNGWKVGRNAMQDWQAAANNWLLNAQTYADKAASASRNDIMSPNFNPNAPRLHSGGQKDYSIPL